MNWDTLPEQLFEHITKTRPELSEGLSSDEFKQQLQLHLYESCATGCRWCLVDKECEKFVRSLLMH
jgi:hypothetical protein